MAKSKYKFKKWTKEEDFIILNNKPSEAVGMLKKRTLSAVNQRGWVIRKNKPQNKLTFVTKTDKIESSNYFTVKHQGSSIKVEKGINILLTKNGIETI